MSVAIRPASSEDLAGILGLEESIFVNDAWSPAQMRAELGSPHTSYVVVVDDVEGIVGYGGVQAPSASPDADIQTIAVVPSFRRAGLGRAIMAELIGAAWEVGAERVFLEVRADNPAAQALYVDLGFEEVGVRPHYYQPDDVDAVVMRLEFHGGASAGPGPIGASS
ncbi:ribosomal protein S18-alanine N-acetyltransferase [Labedella endophytica]|uniref:Ribosomal-protein-alanine N-acetyltransferase n=1 Tax=Labedella endophytica TaxID=1523160 RepID=A0A433JPW1_9MICO|nr:ribosomal protein S18-alanine N-acetyltransferase [Labedella endophytica]RUQ98928.1 ribosomal-protein-alanine N-acetyltransferase [Labedella endophytica]